MECYEPQKSDTVPGKGPSTSRHEECVSHYFDTE